MKIKFLLKLSALFAFLTTYATNVFAQELEWQKVLSSSHNVNVVHSVSKNNRTAVLVNFQGTLNIGSKTLGPGDASSFAILLMDDKGTITHDFYLKAPHGFEPITATQIAIDNSNNIYLTGRYRTAITFAQNISTSTQFPDGGFLLRFNANLLPQWIECFGDRNGHALIGPKLHIAFDDSQNPILMFSFSRQLNFTRTQQSFVSNSQSPFLQAVAVLKFNSSGVLIDGNVINSTHNVTLQHCTETDYSMRTFLITDNFIRYKGNNYFGGQSINAYFEIAKNDLSVQFSKAYNSRLIVSGMAKGKAGNMLIWGNLRSGNYSIDGQNFSLSSEQNFFGSQTSTNEIKIVFVTEGSGQSAFVSGEIWEDDVFISGFVNFGTKKFKDTTINNGQHSSGLGFLLEGRMNGDVVEFKSFNGRSHFASMIKSKDGISFMGQFTSSFNFMNSNIQSQANNNLVMLKGLFYKLEIISAPKTFYCAGEDMEIKYNFKGKLSTNNRFTVELSDMNGNLSGNWKEIGSLETNQSGTITAKIPARNIPTGHFYRIRIRTSQPEGYNDFEKNFSHFSIHSRDSAFAGGTIYFCPGDEIQLNATGGSMWNWSPSTYFVNKNESNSRNPLIKPENPITYRLIIDDDKQCGFRDTAYVNLAYKPSPDVMIEGPTSFCPNQSIALQARILNENINGYLFEWRNKGLPFVFNKNSSFTLFPSTDVTFELTVKDKCNNSVIVDHPLKRSQSLGAKIMGKMACKDRPAELTALTIGCNEQESSYAWEEVNNPGVILSTERVFRPFITKSTRYKLTITAKRTNLSASDEFTVDIDSSFAARATTDTVVCKGASIMLSAWADACDTEDWEYRWTNNRTSEFWNTKNIWISPENETEYFVHIRNTHSNLSGYAQTKVKIINEKLELIVPADTLICSGEAHQLKAWAKGGYANGYEFTWTDHQNNRYTGNQPIVNPKSSTIYHVTLHDGCSPEIPKGELVVMTRQPLILDADLKDTTLCYGQSLTADIKFFGGIKEQQRFTFSGEGTKWLAEERKLLIKPEKSTEIKLHLSDGCTLPEQEFYFKINVLAPLTSEITSETELCENDSITLQAKASGGTGNYTYCWELDENIVKTGKTVSAIAKYGRNAILKIDDGCSMRSEPFIYPYPVIEPLKVELRGPAEVCENEMIEVKALIDGANENLTYRWLANGSPVGQNLPSIAIKVNSNLNLELSVDDGCRPSPAISKSILSVALPKPRFSFTQAENCIPLNLHTKDESTDHESINNKWYLLAGNFKKEVILPFTIESVGNYSLMLRAENRLGCADSIVVPFSTFSRASADFTINKNTVIVNDEVIMETNDPKITEAQWQLSNGETLTGKKVNYKFSEVGLSLVKTVITDVNGCTNFTQKSIPVNSELKYYLPNAFNPNSEWLENRVFRPAIIGAESYELIILNRKRDVVFTCKNSTDCAWDGTFKGEWAPEGVYSYQLKIKPLAGELSVINGIVTLLR